MCSGALETEIARHAPSERRPKDAELMPFMAGNAVAGAAATRVAVALRRMPTVGIAVVMAAMENIVWVLVCARVAVECVAPTHTRELFASSLRLLALRLRLLEVWMTCTSRFFDAV